MRTLMILVALLCATLAAFAQSAATAPPANKTVFNILRVEVDEKEKRLEVGIHARKANGQAFTGKDAIEATEKILDGQSGEVFKLERSTTVKNKDVQNAGTFLFLLDISGSMGVGASPTKIDEAKRLLAKMIKENNLPENSTYLTTFYDLISERQLINKNNVDQLVSQIEAPITNEYTSLNRAISQSLQELKTFTGARHIILITDGMNAPRDPSTSITKSDLIQELKQLDTLLQLHVVGIGDQNAANFGGLDNDYLDSLVVATPSQKDEYSFAQGVEGLGSAVEIVIQKNTENLILYFFPDKCVYNSENRELSIAYTDGGEKGTATFNYIGAASGTPISLCYNEEYEILSGTLPAFVLGLLLAALCLVILLYTVPYIAYRAFKQRYVITYQQYLDKKKGARTNVTRLDPYTQTELQPSDQVVTKCEHIMRWDSWKANDDQCYNYPNRCSIGTAEYKKRSNFFAQQGANRKLNWLWFGLLGGLFSWALLGLLKELEVLRPLNDLLQEAVGADNVNSQDNMLLANSRGLFLQAILGLSLGFFMTLALSLAEEIGQSRKFSWGRIGLRVLIGTVILGPVFFGMEFLINMLQTQLPNLSATLNDYVTRLISWVGFATILGYIVTINSSIEAMKGIKGGLLAGVLGFHVYYLLQMLLQNYPVYANVIGLMAMGAILGWVMVTVVERLTDFHLEVLSPENFRQRKIDISKWLISRDIKEIKIGTEQGSEVFIKWQDEQVKGLHARLSYDGSRVLITPVGDVLIDDRVITDPTPLSDGSIIKLGQHSKSSFAFRANKIEELNPAIATKNGKGGTQSTPNQIKIKAIRKSGAPRT